MAFLVLAGAEEGVRKSNCRVVKINKEETNHYCPVQRLTTVVWLSSRDGTCLELVEDRRAVIVRSKVERPLTSEGLSNDRCTDRSVRKIGASGADGDGATLSHCSVAPARSLSCGRRLSSWGAVLGAGRKRVRFRGRHDQ